MKFIAYALKLINSATRETNTSHHVLVSGLNVLLRGQAHARRQAVLTENRCKKHTHFEKPSLKHKLQPQKDENLDCVYIIIITFWRFIVGLLVKC